MRITRHPLLPPVGGLRAVPADETIVQRLESSFAAAMADGAFASRFFRRLVADDPGLLDRFPDDVGARARVVTVALAAVVAALRQPDGLRHAAGEHGRRALARCVDPLADLPVSRHVVATLAEALGEHWTPELDREWTRTFEIVATLRGGPA